VNERVTGEQVARLRRFGTEEAAGTQLGRLWLQRLRDHGRELLQHYSTHPRLQEKTDQALARAAALVESRDAAQPPVVDDKLVSVVEAALAELHDRGSPQLRDVTEQARADLHAARGKSIRDMFPADRPRP
jgi:hypothetical protein